MQTTLPQRPITTYLILVTFIVMLAGCVTAKQKKLEAGFQPLSGQELQTLFAETRTGTFASQTHDIVTKVQWFKDGSQKFSNPKRDDKGVWRIVGDEMGSKWQITREGREEFSTWFSIGPDKFETYNRAGVLRGVVTLD